MLKASAVQSPMKPATHRQMKEEVNFHLVPSKIFFVPPCLCGWVLFLQRKCATQPVLHSSTIAWFIKKAYSNGVLAYGLLRYMCMPSAWAVQVTTRSLMHTCGGSVAV